MWSIIDDFLYLGTINDACTPSNLIDYKISHLINLSVTKLILDQSFEILHLPLKDSLDENILDYFDETNLFLEACHQQTNGRCLVVCKHGRSRSVAIVLAYLIKHDHHSLASAYQLIYRICPTISPNKNYFKQLKIYSSQFEQTVSPFIYS